MDFKKDATMLYSSTSNYMASGRHVITTTVYSMLDDRGRLILRIDNASLADSGIYSVHPPEHFVVNRSSGLPTVPLAAAIIKFFRMFPSDQLDQIILRCPLTPVQRVLSWEWREPIPPNSELAAVLPKEARPSRTVSYNESGVFSHGNVEIGSNLEYVRILDPKAPEAPTPLWCKFEMEDLWHGRKGHPSYYEIHWSLYDPINVKVKLHNSSSEPLINDLESSRPFGDDYSAQYQSGMPSMAETQPRLIEGYPARLVCLFSHRKQTQTAHRPMQIAAWFRGEDYRSIPQPPFHVNRTPDEGISWLTVRAFPVGERLDEQSQNDLAVQIPYEKITCVVNTLIDEVNNFTVTKNASLVLEVIRHPRIIETEEMSAEVSLGDYVKLTCLALANGRPNITIDFSATAGRRPWGSSAESRFEQKEFLETGSPEDVQMAGWRPLMDSYRTRIYRSDIDPSRPMLHTLVVDIRGALREHHGSYRCRVTNAAGQAQHIGHLLVRSKPSITIQPQQSTYFLARQPLFTSCLVSGYPLALTNLSSLQSLSLEELNSATTSAISGIKFLDQADKMIAQQQMSSEIRKNRILMEPEDIFPVRLLVLTEDRVQEKFVKPKLSDLRVGIYEGINATYSVVINHRPQGKIYARCEYVHTDGTVVADEIEIKQATPPAPPKVIPLCSGPGAVIFGVTNPLVKAENEATDRIVNQRVLFAPTSVIPLCSGPGAVIFGVTNPLVKAENEATDRIVNQRVLFAPTSEFHSASNLASKSIILDKNGQPISEKTVDGDEEEIQQALLHPDDQVSQIDHLLRRQSKSERDMLSIIPLTNLLPDTNYTFEWSSANQFHLTTTLQFITATTPLKAPSKPTHFVFLVPTASHLRISVFLDDPCPYENGGRAELSNILIRYRPAVQELGHASYRRGSEHLFGYGNWSDTNICLQNQDKEPVDYRPSHLSQQQPPIKWSGDVEIQCDVEVKDPQADLEVAVATVNRFGISPWVSSIYRASDAMTSAYYQGSSSHQPVKSMCQTPILKEFIRERVDEYLDHLELISNSTVDLKKLTASPQFQHFREKLLLDLLQRSQVREVNASDDEEETFKVQTQASSITDFETNRPKPLLSELGSSFSTTMTQQDADFFCPNGNHLTEMAQSLNPRISSPFRRRELLKQIIGMPSIETRICDAWTIFPETSIAEPPSSDGPIRLSTSKHSSGGNSSPYGIRQGLFDALVDDDIELHSLALKFISKAFSSSSGNIEECYILLADYLEGQFTLYSNNIPPISNGLDIDDPKMARIMRAFLLLHEFHKKLPNFWLRYSENSTESLMDRCLSLLSVGYSPILEMTSEDAKNRLTPLHIISILDPKAQWFSLWMRGAHGCRPMLKKLTKNKQIISMWTTSCVNVFLSKPEHSHQTKQTVSFTSHHIKSAYFLHSLHALTTLLCSKESHSKIFPINISKRTINNFADEDRTTLVKSGTLPVRIFMKLYMGFILNLKEESTGEDSLMNKVDKCFQRLATSPVANVLCFGLDVDKFPPSISRKSRRTSVNPNASSQSDVSVVDMILSEICLIVDKATGETDRMYPISSSICVLTKALVNICMTVQDEEYFAHQRVDRRNDIIIHILTSCLEFISSEKFESFCKEDRNSVQNIAYIMDHVLIVFSRVHLSIKRSYDQSAICVLRRALKTFKFLRNKCKDERYSDESILKVFEKSLNYLLFSILKYPKGTELIVSSDDLNNLDPKFICSGETIASRYEFELLINQLSSSSHGFEFLNRNGFIAARFEGAWKVLEGSGTESVVDVDQSQVVNYSLKDSLEVEKSLTNDAFTPIDQNDYELQFALNQLIRVFANLSSVIEALKYPLPQITSSDGLQIAPRTLSDFIDRTIMLDSSTKLSKLCRPDETLVFGLKYGNLIAFINTFRFLSAMISSLNIFLLLESRFGIRNMLKSAQLRCSTDADGRYAGKFMIDEGVIERNRLLVKCSVLGGPTERQLPPQCLCEHSADPYPYPIITSLSIDSFEPFINKSTLFCNHTPCTGSLDNPPVTSKRPITTTFVHIVLNSLKASSASRVKADHDILNKLPNIKWKINSLAKHLSKSNKQILDIGCLFDICLRATRGTNQSISSSVQPNSASSMLQPWEEDAITLVIEYGRRIKALDPTVSENTQKTELADMLLYIKTLAPSNELLEKNFGNNNFGGTNKQNEIVQTFDWFAALIFLIYNGHRSRAFEFLRGFKETVLANFLWSSSASSSTPHQYTLCHAFETILACEMPQEYNTFLLSGYSPSLVFRCWLQQCFLNYLDWPEIRDFLLICLLCGVKSLVFTTFLMGCFADAPIKWPDPRLLRATVNPRNRREIEFEWPVSKYLQLDSVESFSVTVTKAKDKEYSKVFISRGMGNIELDEWNTEYNITFGVETELFSWSESAKIKIKTGANKQIGEEYSGKIPKLTQIIVKDNETRIVVLKENSTDKCLLVIYDQSVVNENYTIEATGECRDDKDSALAVTIPMKRSLMGILPGLQLIHLDIKPDDLKSFTDFRVVNYTRFNENSFEVDHPLDIYGKLEVVSPEKCILTITYRPPPSNPKLIKNFIFIINSTGEEHVFNIVEDDQIVHSNEDTNIVYSELVKVQSSRDKSFSFIVKSITTFPGTHTLIAFTNNAQHKNATHSIIMPDLHLSVPREPEININNWNVDVRWRTPKHFGGLCNYTVDAIANRHYDSQEFQPKRYLSEYATISVKFTNLNYGTNYTFYIVTQCNSSRIERIKIGERETSPGIPGTPQNPRLNLLDPKTVNFTWNPPVIFRGRQRTYYYYCKNEGKRGEYRGIVSECYAIIKNVLDGNISCIVKALSKTLNYEEMRGNFTNEVIMEIPSPDTPFPQPIQIIEINETTLELNLTNPRRFDILGYSVLIDSDLKISFYIGEDLNVTNGDGSTIDAKKTGESSFILLNLTPHQEYTVSVTTYFVRHTTSKLYTVKPVPPKVALPTTTPPSQPSTSTQQPSTEVIEQTRTQNSETTASSLEEFNSTSEPSLPTNPSVSDEKTYFNERDTQLKLLDSLLVWIGSLIGLHSVGALALWIAQRRRKSREKFIRNSTNFEMPILDAHHNDRD
nr:protein broad minded [Hymenolepis microstoma]